MQNQSTPNSTNYSPAQSQNHLKIETPSHHPSTSSSTSSSIHQHPDQINFQNDPISVPHKRPMSQTPSILSHHHYYKTPLLNPNYTHQSHISSSSISVALSLLRHFCCIRWVRIRLLRFCVFLSVPALYVFTSNHHRRNFLLDFLCVFAFSSALLISINLVLPRLPSIRLFLTRTFPINLCSKIKASEPRPPVVWSIGSKRKSEKRKNSGSWVQVYRNGDVYEGEFHKGQCSGNGVYYYQMSGRYEGDWIDGKYDGYGVETWARGSRYRGQYRQGLRNGIGVYRFFSGDVYAGEWCNGQCHGCGVYTCEDGGRYVGEFKWGVKHGLGHYHFRLNSL